GSAFSTMSISDGLMARSSSGYSPVTFWRKTLSGRRIPSSSANFSAGMILPRAIPAMSGMIASTSEIPWSRKNCWISLGMLDLFSWPGLPGLGAIAARRAERREQSTREGVIHDFPFRVPLHGDRKARRARHPKRLHHPIGSTRLDREIGAKTVDALRVEGVDLQPIRPCERAQ